MRGHGCRSAQQFRILAGVDDPPAGYVSMTEDELRSVAAHERPSSDSGASGGQAPQHRPERQPSRRLPKPRAGAAAAVSLGGRGGGAPGPPRGRPVRVGERAGGAAGVRVACPCHHPVGPAQLAAAGLSPLFCAEPGVCGLEGGVLASL